jgi:RND family efflux transporter MFP subunit
MKSNTPDGDAKRARMEILALAPDCQLIPRPFNGEPRYELRQGGETRETLGEPELRGLIMMLRGAAREDIPRATGLANPDLLRKRLERQGLVQALSSPREPWRPTERPKLVQGAQLKTTLVRVGGELTLSYADALLSKACDGKRGIPQLCQALATRNITLSYEEAQEALEMLAELGLVEGMPPRLVAGTTFAPELVLAIPPSAGGAYAFGPSEASLINACDGKRTAAELAELDCSEPTPPAHAADHLLVRARAMGLLGGGAPAVVAPAHGASKPERSLPLPPTRRRPLTADDIAAVHGDVEPVEPTVADPALIVSSIPPAEPPPEDATDRRDLDRTALKPSLGSPSFTSTDLPPPMPDTAMQQAEQSARLAALMSLSLDAAPPQLGPAVRQSKLPWFLLFFVVVGGTSYHLYTIKTLSPLVASNADRARDGEPRPVRTEIARASVEPAATIIAAGYMAAREPITVGVTTSGRVRDVTVQSGSVVKKGQLMARLDTAQIEAQLALARARERDAARALARMKTLFNAQAATQVDLEKTEGLVDIARAERLVIAAQLQQSQIRAPINGTVLEVLAHAGEVLTPSANNTSVGVVKVADLSQLVAEVDVGESDIPRVRVGQRVELTTDAHADRKYEGEVREIAQQADRTRGTVQVKVAVTVSDGSLKPGMAVRAMFAGEARSAVRILKTAIDGGTVWVVGDDGTVRRQPVTIAPGPAREAEVLSGLKDGQRFVVEGFERLQEGGKLPGS